MEPIFEEKSHKPIEWIRPGVVGSVGVTHVSERLKQSSPDMPLRFKPGTVGPQSERMGSNVQDGAMSSFQTGGLQPRVYDGHWVNGRNFKTKHGWVYQDLRAPDRIMEPVLGATPRYSWYNKIARTVEARRTGELFLPLPGPYGPTSITRGNQVPRVVSVETPSNPIISSNESWSQGFVNNQPSQDQSIVDQIIAQKKKPLPETRQQIVGRGGTVQERRGVSRWLDHMFF